MEVQLRRSCLVLAVLALLSISAALGQYSAVIAACQWDSKHACTGASPKGEQFARCIRANFQTLSEGMQSRASQDRSGSHSLRSGYCASLPPIKPGTGRIFLWIKAHYAALSELCKDAMGRAAERNTCAR
jgi:hypothetical protein